MMKRIALAASLALALAACQDDGLSRGSTRHLTPIPPATMALMASKGMSKNDPILIRAYKKESELEVWKRGSDGKYALLKTYPICRWSGQLGPKTREGDRQVPEGFYTVTPAQMNPNSAFYLSFDTGYPNAFDRSFGRTGGNIMVHGSCSSRGCFAMTDKNIAEIYAIAREAFASGQRGFQFHSYPFRMTAKNLAQHRLDPNIGFWKNLKEGHDYFEITREEPRVAVASGRYQFQIEDESIMTALAAKRRQDEQQVAELVSKGEKAIKLVYHDGDSHESFRTALANAMGTDGSLAVDARNRFGDVSRPEGLSSGPRVIALDGTGRPQPDVPSTAMAFASLGDEAPAPAPAAMPAPTKVAAAAPVAGSAPEQPAAAGPQETPFYKKMFNDIGDLFSTPGPQEPATPPQKRVQATTGVSPTAVR